MSKYRCCHLTSAHSVFDARIFHKQMKSLARAGYDVRLIVPHSKNETVDGIKIIAVPKPRNRAERMLLTSWRILGKALRERAHVYHFHDPDLIPVGICLKLFGSRVIYDVHEDYPESIKTKAWLPLFMRNVVAGIFGIFEGSVSCFLDGAVAATEGISRRFKSTRVITLSNYPILYYAVDSVDSCTTSENHTMIYAGVLAESRGTKELVESLEYIDDRFKLKLKLLGKFAQSHFGEQVKAMKAFSKVDFVGYVSHTEVYSHLSAADIGLICFHPVKRYQTALSTKLFEYMAAGLPVVISAFPLWKEFLDKNRCGIAVDSSSPEEIARKVEFLLQHPQLMREMGENGQKMVAQRYNWGNEERKLLKMYKEIVS